MNNDSLKDLLFGHIKDQADATLLQKRLQDYQLHASDRSAGSYVLVNVPSQKDRRQITRQVRPQHRSRDQAGDIR